MNPKLETLKILTVQLNPAESKSDCSMWGNNGKLHRACHTKYEDIIPCCDCVFMNTNTKLINQTFEENIKNG